MDSGAEAATVVHSLSKSIHSEAARSGEEAKDEHLSPGPTARGSS